MAEHLKTGKKGEEIGTEWLKNAGFEILDINWRFGRYELDIVARDAGTLVFVEVKTRSYDWYGKPEQFIDQRKERRIAAAAAAYMQKTGYEAAVRFDVLSVLKNPKGQWKVEHIRDAFFPGLSL